MSDLSNSTSDLEAFIAESVEGLKMATSAHKATWRLGEEKSWGIDQDAGEIVFLFSNGKKAVAAVQIIGTLNTGDSTFMWGWDHPSVRPALQEDAKRVKSLGEEHGLEEFTTQTISCSEARAWGYTALAMRLSGANGAYRAQASPDTFVYLTFGEVTLEEEAN